MQIKTVILLNSFCHVQGGASRVAIDEAIGLARTGLRVIFVGAAGPIAQELLNSNIEVVCLGQAALSNEPSNLSLALRGLWNQSASNAMANILHGLDPTCTIVHLHGFSHALSSSPVRCAVSFGFKVVMTLHEYFAACPNGAFFDYNAQEVCTRRPLSGSCLVRNCDKRRYAHKLYRVARSVIQRVAGRIPNGIAGYITLSEASKEIMQPYLPANARFFSLGNPIHVSRRPPVQVEKNSEVISIGRLDPEKGILQLLEAARLTDTKLLHVGDGALRSLVEASGLCDVTGWVPRDVVLQYLERARCLVFPSLWHETYGLCVDEASARGVPSIVSNITAAAERVTHNITGWCVKASDPSDIARHLVLIRDPTIVSAAGRASYDAFWNQPPLIDAHARSLIEIYQSILFDSHIQCTQ